MAAADDVGEAGSDMAHDRLVVEADHGVGRAVAGQAEPRDGAEGIDVGGLVRLGPEPHLWGDEARRAVHGTGVTPGHARGPEVEQHRAPVGGHRDVGGRDVGVQASSRVQVRRRPRTPGVRTVTTSPGRR